MQVIALQSGSNGNCIFVASRGRRLLLDAGISGRQAQRRLAAHAHDVRQVDAVVISHDHYDHVHAAGIYSRQFGLPVFVTEATRAAAESCYSLGPIGEVHYFQRGQRLHFGPLTLETIPTPHDGVDGSAFVVDDGERRLGVLTDLGHVFESLPAVLAGLDAVLLESNYDPDMLEAGPYPVFLKRRIRGDGGHLSNEEAAELLRHVGFDRLRWACLAHLSEQNNNPALALATHRDIVGARLPLHVASRYVATPLPEL
jgi:phosphoribosyl 1,2-cyclic phosphodiesterase